MVLTTMETELITARLIILLLSLVVTPLLLPCACPASVRLIMDPLRHLPLPRESPSTPLSTDLMKVERSITRWLRSMDTTSTALTTTMDLYVYPLNISQLIHANI